MKTQQVIRKVAILILSAMVFTACSKEGPAGPQGEQGPKGDTGSRGPRGIPGNANVKVYSFSITAAQWGPNLHYGDGNIFRSYKIHPTQVDGVNIAQFFNAGGVVLAYVKGGGVSYNEWKLTPHVYSKTVGASAIGIRVECIPSRSCITICKTTNGWNSLHIDTDELPAKTEVRIVLMEASTFESKKATINFLDYAEVKVAFHLAD